MTALTAIDKAAVDAAETYFAEVATITGDILLAGTLPNVEQIDDMIARLTGVRAIVAGDIMPAGRDAQRGLRRLLEARRADVEALLDGDREEQRTGTNSCVEPVTDRIAAYEHELAGLDDALTRLASYEALGTVRNACAALLLHRKHEIESGVQTGRWSPSVVAFADDEANEEQIRGIIGAMCAQYGVEDVDLLAKLGEVAEVSA